MSDLQDRILILSPRDDLETIKVLSSEVRLRILDLLAAKPHNVNEIAEALSFPLSTVATNVLLLEEAGLIATESLKAKKGSQKVCRAQYGEVLVRFGHPAQEAGDGAVEVAMPIGLYTNYEVSSPCGLCSPESVIGYLDVPESFQSPDRMKAGLPWFESGWVEYKFPNNSRLKDKPVARLEIVTELSSETPGTTKNWSVTTEGTCVDGMRVSGVTLEDLNSKITTRSRSALGRRTRPNTAVESTSSGVVLETTAKTSPCVCFFRGVFPLRAGFCTLFPLWKP